VAVQWADEVPIDQSAIATTLSTADTAEIEQRLRRLENQAYGPDQGLSNLVTWSVTHDAKDLSWVGTEYGAFRYDGSVFQRIGHSFASARVSGRVVGASMTQGVGGQGRGARGRHGLWLDAEAGAERWAVSGAHAEGPRIPT
jgi:hypothetical protein